MSWNFNTVEPWVKAALLNIGYNESQALLGAWCVTWLQQRGAPGVAAMAQHIDFLSAYQLTPKQGGDANATCPIMLSETLLDAMTATEQTFNGVRQPLLLLPTLATQSGTVSWNEFKLTLNGTRLDIEYERKTLRQVLVEKANIQWVPRTVTTATKEEFQTVPNNRHSSLLTEISTRELVYVKTIQHYAGALPTREPLDGAPTTDEATSAWAKKTAENASDNTSPPL